MAEVSTCGTMGPLITASGLKIKSAGAACMSGQMAGNTMENGKKTICMDEEFTLGRMVEDMKKST